VLVAGCDDEYALTSGNSDIQDPRGTFYEAYKGDFPGLTMYADHREMLQKERLDIVTVGTSDHRHADIVVNAANAGVKGIFCEKPLSTNFADTDRMLAACRDNGTVLSVDHTRRFTPLWRYAKEELLDKGAIGEVQWIIGRLQGSRAMMFRNGTHVIDAMLWTAGCDEGNRPEWVMGGLRAGLRRFRRLRHQGNGWWQGSVARARNQRVHLLQQRREGHLHGRQQEHAGPQDGCRGGREQRPPATGRHRRRALPYRRMDRRIQASRHYLEGGGGERVQGDASICGGHHCGQPKRAWAAVTRDLVWSP
jgi:predicted dehydrogenase